MGEYVCQAYSIVDSPVSIYFTIKAFGPVHIRKGIDDQYTKYLIDPPTIPKEPTNVYPPPPRVAPRPRVPIGKCMSLCLFIFCLA